MLLEAACDCACACAFLPNAFLLMSGPSGDMSGPSGEDDNNDACWNGNKQEGAVLGSVTRRFIVLEEGQTCVRHYTASASNLKKVSGGAILVVWEEAQDNIPVSDI